MSRENVLCCASVCVSGSYCFAEGQKDAYVTVRSQEASKEHFSLHSITVKDRMPNPQCFWVLCVCVCIPHSTQSIPSEYLDPHFSHLSSCAVSISFQEVFFPQWYLSCYLPLSPLHSLLCVFKYMCLSSLFLELAL